MSQPPPSSLRGPDGQSGQSGQTAQPVLADQTHSIRPNNQQPVLSSGQSSVQQGKKPVAAVPQSQPVTSAQTAKKSPILGAKTPTPIVQPSNLADKLGSVSIDAHPPGASIPRNVSFSTESAESKAYREHNPPTVVRQLDAARAKGLTPSESAVHLVAPPRSGTPKFAGPPASTGASQAPASVTHVSSPEMGTASPQLVPRERIPSLAPEEQKSTNELHILLAVTGSVATIKIAMIIHKLKQIYHQRAIIQLVATSASRLFFDPKDIPRDVKVWYDEDEWRSRELKPKKSGLPPTTADHQLHVQLRRWADILVVAPCSANTLAKLTYGICDNLLTSVFRVWNPAVPILLAPAMNTHMYTNPVTKRHYNTLKEEFPFVEILKPVEKVLVCGDIGMGGMREWTDIVQTVAKRLGIPEEDDDEEDEEDDETV